MTRSTPGAIEGLAAAIAAADSVVGVGAGRSGRSGTRRPRAWRSRRRRGVAKYEPEDLTITVGAGTSFAVLAAALAEHGQECPLDPVDPAATIGGVVACGLSGIRRLRHGPLREQVLEVRFVTGDGRLVKGGGQTVKNVTGYDLPRLLVGSLGTLGVLVQLTLRCRPLAACSRWFACADPPDLYRAAAMLWDGKTTSVLLEGALADVDVQAKGLAPGTRPRCRPATTAGASRSRRGRCPPSAPHSMRFRARGGARRSASAPCTSPATTPRCWPAHERSRTRMTVGCCARPERPASTASDARFQMLRSCSE